MHLVYKGPSVIDGQPIICLLTGLDRPSDNPKTGPMLQTWILREDMKPHTAVKLKEDKSVCGECPLRGDICYVNAWQAPNNVYQSYLKGNYEIENLNKLGYRRGIRLGAYGDPAAVPLSIWDQLLKHADFWTGYTHSPLIQPDLKRYCQCSVETAAQAELYQNLGWKTFRVKKATDPISKGEVECPYTKNPSMTCNVCRLCNGAQRNVAVDAHGSAYKTRNFENYYETLVLQQPNPVRELPASMEA